MERAARPRETLTGAPLELRDVAPSGPLETIRRARPLFSSRSGIVREIGAGVCFAGDPVCFALGNHVCDASRLPGQARHADRSGAAAFSLPEALAAAIGEAVERYCMRFYEPGELVFGTWRELSREHDLVHPERVRMHSPEQVAQARRQGSRSAVADVFTEDSPIRWTRAWSLTEGAWKLVPAHLVYLPYVPAPGEARVGWNTSTGLAAGCTLEEAVLAGLCEWIERDAFALCWLCRVIPRRIRIDRPELARLVESRFHTGHPAVRLELWDLTLDTGVAAVAAWMTRPMEFGPGVFVGAAARLDPEAAVRKALVELAQCVPCCRYTLRQLRSWTPREDFSDVADFERHSVFYLKRPDLVPAAFGFCRAVPREVALGELADHSTGTVLGDLRHCVGSLARIGHEALVVDVTTPDVRDLGLRVVRVLVTGLVNLAGHHRWPWLGGKRPWRVPHRLGWEHLDWSPLAGFNPYPHPFP